MKRVWWIGLQVAMVFWLMLAEAHAVVVPDVITVGAVSGQQGATIEVPVYVNDLSGTPLGMDQPAGSKIQGLSFKVTYSPTAAVSAIAFSRAGIAASLTPLFEYSLSSGNTISYVASFGEISNQIPFTLDSPGPGDQVARLTVTISPGASPDSIIALVLDPSVTELDNQGGTNSEDTTQGNLSLVNGSITVLPAPWRTITVSAGANGAISPSGTVSVALNSDQRFVITPAAGYHVADVLVDGVSVGSVSRYTFLKVIADHTISATFGERSLWFVDNHIAASGSGTSWASAFKTVQEAVDAAKAGDEIWVKASHFLLTAPVTINKAMSIYGGFAGTESQRETRNWYAYPTSLDGQEKGQCLYLGADATSVTLDGFVITKCHGSLGGGMFSEAAAAFVANCKFEANQADSGGAVYELDAGVKFSNCSFWGNTANLGGAIFSHGSTVSLVNCSLSGNSASLGGGGISNGGNGTLVIVNSILWGDKHGESADEIDSTGGNVTVTYSDIQGGHAGTGNIDIDPKFVDAASGNLRLKMASPCIDKGTDSGVSLASKDLDDNTRTAHGPCDDLPVVDMGAYEYQTSVTVAALLSPSGTIITNIPTYTWNAVYNSAWYYLYVADAAGTTIMQWYSAEQAGCSSGSGTCSVGPQTALGKGSATWWVQTWNPGGSGPWSSGMAFSVAPAQPGQVSLISPSGITDTNTPTYKWNADPNATWYYLFVTDTSGVKILQWCTAEQAGCSIGTGTCSLTPQIAVAAGSATWWIQAWSPGGVGSWSTSKTFIAPTPVPPGKVGLISPAGTIDTNLPTYKWNADPRATWYYLWVGDSTGTKIIQWYSAAQAGCPSGGGTCSLTPEIPLAQGSATWWILTWSPNGSGEWSTGVEFIVPTPVPPGKVALSSPSGTIHTCTPTYTWDSDIHATWYYLWVSDSTGAKVQKWVNASEASCPSGGGNCSVTPEVALAQGSAEGWIMTWSPNGSGPWSSGTKFIVNE
jgi:hypothetical protein